MKGKKNPHYREQNKKNIRKEAYNIYQLAIIEIEAILVVTPAQLLSQQRTKNKDLERIYELSKVKQVLHNQTRPRT